MGHLIDEMKARGYKPASRSFSIDQYAQFNRRVLVRTKSVYKEQVQFVEDWSLPDRFWLSIARFKYLNTRSGSERSEKWIPSHRNRSGFERAV